MTVIIAERTAHTDYVWGVVVLREDQSQKKRQKQGQKRTVRPMIPIATSNKKQPESDPMRINPHINRKLIYLNCYYLI